MAFALIAPAGRHRADRGEHRATSRLSPR
jgi:hypothetical protein